MTETYELSADLDARVAALVLTLLVVSVVLLVLELSRSGGRGRPMVAVSGVIAVLLLSIAALRPVKVTSKDSLVGPRVVLLVDSSRSMDLPGFEGARRDVADGAVRALLGRSDEVRETLLGFGEEGTVALPEGATTPSEMPPLGRSDLESAFEALSEGGDEPPSAIVVVSDGRLDRPPPAGTKEAVTAALGHLKVPVHTVAVAEDAPPDAAIRSVNLAGAAVAHQPLTLRVEVACTGGLACDELPVTVRELREEGDPWELARGVAKVDDGKAVLELGATIDRAGARIIEVSLEPPPGQTIVDNDARLLTLNVGRDRVRVLHVAGRPTYDVRALRMWLKSDASVDLVAFFILREREEEVRAPPDELALIPFPVDELFTQHLPSFDAVVLQDFNAAEYGLSKHLANLRRYVERGGGIIMVGGAGSFGPGAYGGTPFAPVLPVELSRASTEGVDLASFTPRFTEAGRVAPVLGPLRALIGEGLPDMPGTNVVGDPRVGAHVLWTHPTRNTPTGAPMPVLAVGEFGSGRTIALTVDGSHRLLFSTFAADAAAGRAHGAFWDAMLGWLMRDPRFEPAVIDVDGTCIAGVPAHLRVRPLPGTGELATVSVRQLGSGKLVHTGTIELTDDPEGTVVDIGALDRGGYAATVEISKGAAKAPPTRRDFACEAGGAEWADVRPDVERLRAIADATGGRFVVAADAASIPLPEATRVATERTVAPILPPWAWALGAALMLGLHWIVRRKVGFS